MGLKPTLRRLQEARNQVWMPPGVIRDPLNITGVSRTRENTHNNFSQNPYQSTIQFVPGHGIPALKTRAAMYRAYMRHLRLLPDPYLWTILQPSMRELCRSSSWENLLDENDMQRIAQPDGTVDTDEIRKKTLKKARVLLNDLRAAVACHSHALERLLETVYAVRGSQRYGIIRRIEKTAEPDLTPREKEHLLGPGRKSLPPPVVPLLSPPPADDGHTHIRARDSKHVPPKAGARKARQQWLNDWTNTRVPLVLPKGSQGETGLEDKGVVESLRALAGIGETYVYSTTANPPAPPRRESPDYRPMELPRTRIRNVDLPTYDLLSPWMKRIFPYKLNPTLREVPYPKPASHETRSNRLTWWNPVPLNHRLVTHCYQRLWEKMVWVRPRRSREAESVEWIRCTYDDMRKWEAGAPEHELRPPLPPIKRVDKAKEEDTNYVYSWASHHERRKMKKTRIDRLLKAGKTGVWEGEADD